MSALVRPPEIPATLLAESDIDVFFLKLCTAPLMFDSGQAGQRHHGVRHWQSCGRGYSEKLFVEIEEMKLVTDQAAAVCVNR